MLLDLKECILKYKMKITGILHIGAHYGEEYKLYEDLNIHNTLFFEPVTSNWEQLIKNVPPEKCIKAALGNYNGFANINIEYANKGQSSSILTPNLHLLQYPHIQFTATEKVSVITLDSLNLEEFNTINMDVQGYELDVLHGAVYTLEKIDYIFTEVNRAEVYTNCAKVEELDEFLKEEGFNRVETNWAGHTWGDALYVRNTARK